MNDVSKANRESKTSDLNLELNAITRFRLDEINKIKEYFNSEIKERKDITKKISKYIVTLDYADKICTHSSRYCRVFINFNIYYNYWNN